MDEIKTRIVPQIKGLKVEDFVRFLETETDNGVEYLPQNYKELIMNRQWLINLCKSFY